MKAPASWPHLSQLLPRSPFPIPSYWGVRASTSEFWEDIRSMKLLCSFKTILQKIINIVKFPTVCFYPKDWNISSMGWRFIHWCIQLSNSFGTQSICRRKGGREAQREGRRADKQEPRPERSVGGQKHKAIAPAGLQRLRVRHSGTFIPNLC